MDRWGGSWGLIGVGWKGGSERGSGGTQREFRMTGAGEGELEYHKIYLDINKYINIIFKIYFDKCCFILMYIGIFHVLRYILLNYI